MPTTFLQNWSQARYEWWILVGTRPGYRQDPVADSHFGLAVDDSEFLGTSLAPPPGAYADTYGAVSVANGVMYGEDQAGNFIALDAATGDTLFDLSSGGTSISAPAIVDGTLYWSSGYKLLGATNNKIYALSVDRPHQQ